MTISIWNWNICALSVYHIFSRLMDLEIWWPGEINYFPICPTDLACLLWMWARKCQAKKKTRHRRRNLRDFSMISNQSFNKNRKSCRSEPNHLPKCCESYIRIEEQEFIASNKRTIWIWMGSPSLYPKLFTNLRIEIVISKQQSTKSGC